MRLTITRLVAVAGLVLALGATTSAAAHTSAPPAPSAARITILYDAFGGRAGLTRDWGFAALVEYGGKRILFDTGDNAAIFERNVRALKIDLRTLDFVVISHRHSDHIAGLAYLLKVNPRVTIYAPREGFGVFGSALPATFYRRNDSLPARMRYFDGEPADTLRFGQAWPDAHFVLVDSVTQIAPGFSIISTVSDKPGTLELREISLAVATPAGLVLLVGCSHPGIERIVQASAEVGPHVHMILGGLHLVTTPDDEIERIATALHDRWGIDRIAPGHCTGEPAFAALWRMFGARYVYAGLGTVIEAT
ncbi:MAG TPA: MBL fold metallo-hydrolase [Gemmatimonadales bacterium]|nr:MBL fold metallo-hydrolase [Gemmatimonadales bacterium]